MKALCSSVLVAGLLLILGCEDKDQLPPEVLKAQQQQAQNRLPAVTPLPTTRELLEGPRKTLRLVEWPLTLDVPTSWSINSVGDGAIITLGGPATSGEISIQLVQQKEIVNVARLDSLVAAARKEADAKPHPVNRVELRPLGPAKVLEVRMISNAYVGGKLPPEQWGDVELSDDKTGTKLTTRAVLNPHLVKWTLTIFLPAADQKQATRTLTFQSLKLSEYYQDKDFLEKLVASLKYVE